MGAGASSPRSDCDHATSDAVLDSLCIANRPLSTAKLVPMAEIAEAK